MGLPYFEVGSGVSGFSGPKCFSITSGSMGGGLLRIGTIDQD